MSVLVTGPSPTFSPALLWSGLKCETLQDVKLPSIVSIRLTHKLLALFFHRASILIKFIFQFTYAI